MAAGANYPPGYLYVLWLLGSLATPLGGRLGMPADRALLLLLKVPPIAADLAIAVLLYRAARRWHGPRAGLVAAALYLIVPVTWYDSALWGQMDAVGALVMLAAVLLLLDGWSEPAAALATFGVLIKPQDALALVIVVPSWCGGTCCIPVPDPSPPRDPGSWAGDEARQGRCDRQARQVPRRSGATPAGDLCHRRRARPDPADPPV